MQFRRNAVVIDSSGLTAEKRELCFNRKCTLILKTLFGFRSDKNGTTYFAWDILPPPFTETFTKNEYKLCTNKYDEDILKRSLRQNT